VNAVSTKTTSNFLRFETSALKQSRREGHKEGEEKGHKKRVEQGRREGIKETNIETARNLLKTALTLEQIAQATGLPLKKIKALKGEGSSQ